MGEYKQLAKEETEFPRRPVRLNSETPSSCCLRKGRPWTFWPAIILTTLTLAFASIFTYKHGFNVITWIEVHPGSPSTSTSCPSAASLPYKAGQLKWNFNIASGTRDASFNFIQDQRREFDPKDPTGFNQRIHVAGAVFVQKTKKSSPVSVDLDVKLSHQELADSIHIRAEADGLRFLTATFVEGLPRNSAPSICVVATISIDEGASIEGFDLRTVGLPVDFSRSLLLKADTVKVNTISGRVSNEGLMDAKSIEIETVSAPISGTYPLANLLSLKTVSGSIFTTVTPTEGDRNHVGIFIVDTKSGTVRVMTDVDRIPDREYTTSVTGGSGTISGRYILGSSSRFTTTSASIDASIYPAGRFRFPDLVMDTVSGTITTKLHRGDIRLGDVGIYLSSKSGSVDAKVTSDWEGRVEVKSVTGSLHVEGRDVKIIEDGRDRMPGMARRIVAEKGDARAGKIEGESVSGSVRVDFLSM